MSAHVLLNILNEMGKSDKNARRVRHFIAFFATRYIGTRMLDPVYQMTLKLILKLRHFGVKLLRFCHVCAMLLWSET